MQAEGGRLWANIFCEWNCKKQRTYKANITNRSVCLQTLYVGEMQLHHIREMLW